MEHFVTFDNVCKYYQMGENRIAAADHVTFHIEKGEFCIIVGPSGAGKTTVLNMLGGMDTCDEGHIWLDGKEVSAYNQRQLTEYRRYDVGFVFQFYNLVQNLTALENVEIGLEAAGIPSAARRARALDMLALTGLSGRENQIPAELSGGQKQRVSLARVLALSPPVLLMDEPFAALDAITREQMQLLLVTLHARIGMGIILVTHDVEEALLLGDEVCVMAPGQGIVASRRVEVPRTGDVTDRKLLRELKTILRQSMAGQSGPLLLS